MSHLLDSALDQQRRDEIARNDAKLVASMFPLETAHGITRTGPVKVSGKHLSAAPNEPEFVDRGPLTMPVELCDMGALDLASIAFQVEQERMADDLARHAGKAQRWHQVNDAAARELQQQMQGCEVRP